MLDSLQAGLLRLLGREVDPLGTITPEQLKAVLKSIEGKYNSLRDENKRLKGVIDEHVETIERLRRDLKEARESPAPQAIALLQQQRDELNAQLEELQRTRAQERAEWEAQVAELERKLAEAERHGRDGQEYIEALEVRHQQDLMRMREEIARLEAQVSRHAADAEIRDRLDSEKQTLRARVEELMVERDALEAQVRELQARLEAPPPPPPLEVSPREAALRDAVIPRVAEASILEAPVAAEAAPEAGPSETPQAPPKPSAASESPDRRELLARLIGGGR